MKTRGQERSRIQRPTKAKKRENELTATERPNGMGREHDGERVSQERKRARARARTAYFKKKIFPREEYFMKKIFQS